MPEYTIYMFIFPIITLHVIRIITNSVIGNYAKSDVTSMRRHQLYSQFDLIG